eukprot:GEMP01034073.1.p1 GENE.GEMP01034073.1~~GEMP01034073.1.p1  ORF type:complete len:291 (+),score=62.40 GEMP01034073.1:442-1314(+)
MGNDDLMINAEAGALSEPLMSHEERDDAASFLAEISAEPFNINDPRCANKLRELWGLVFEGEETPSLPADERWKRLGFQSRTPHTDFRGGGVFSLDCVILMARKEPAAVRKLLEDVHKSASGYPFVCACINVCVLILSHLTLTACMPPVSVAQVPLATTRRRKLMMSLLAKGNVRETFGDLFVQVMLKLHHLWLQEENEDAGATARSFLCPCPSPWNKKTRNSLSGQHDFSRAITLTGVSFRTLVNRSARMRSPDEFHNIQDIIPDAWVTYFSNGWDALVDVIACSFAGQ